MIFSDSSDNRHRSAGIIQLSTLSYNLSIFMQEDKRYAG